MTENTPKPAQEAGVVGRIIFFVFLAAALAVFYFYSRPEKLSEQKPLTIGAQLVYAEGAVEYKDLDGEWKRADENTQLKTGSAIEVIGAGKAIINLDDGSAVRLNSNSMAILSSLDPKQIVITNEKGQIYTRVMPGEKTFEVKVGNDIYQSMGTAYKTVNENKLKGVEVYESKVKLIGEDKTEITVENGNKYYVLNSADKKAEKVIIKIVKADTDKDAFVKWNLEEDKKMTEEAVTAEKTTTTTEASTEKTDTTAEEKPVVQETPSTPALSLTASAVSGGVSLSWKVGNIDVSSGFKIVKSTEINPVYPGNDYIYLSESSARSYKWAIMDGKTYYFRVCQYLGGKCGAYSNNVKVTAPVKQTTPSASGDVKSITVTSNGSEKVSWKVSGYSEMGFKIVWSKNSTPTYPTRDGDKYIYLSDPEAASTVLDAFDGSGVYYARVCEYLGGKCGVYSNQIKVNL